MSIFVSYRRKHDGYPARLVREKLVARFGRDAVFLDADTIAPGDDFAERIDAAVGRCKVFLAVIGKEWLDARSPSGGRCLDDPADWVRVEIESAIRKNVRLIPVLVGGAVMPKASDLPESLRELAMKNAIEVRPGPDMSLQLDRLTQAIEDTLGQRILAIVHGFVDHIASLPRPVQQIAHVFARRHLKELMKSMADLLGQGVFISMDESAELTKTLMDSHLRYLSVERSPLDPNVHWSGGYRKLWDSEAARKFEYVLLVDAEVVRKKHADAGIVRAMDTDAYKMLEFMRARGAGCYYCDIHSVVDEIGAEPPFRDFFEVFDDQIALLMDPLDESTARGIGSAKPGFVAKQLKVKAAVLHEGHELLQIVKIIETHRVEITEELIERELLRPQGARAPCP
jgi:hypothetical protein